MFLTTSDAIFLYLVALLHTPIGASFHKSSSDNLILEGCSQSFHIANLIKTITENKIFTNNKLLELKYRNLLMIMSMFDNFVFCNLQ